MIRHALAPVWPPAAQALALPRTLPTNGVTLTFDDGPHPEGTPTVLELLARAGARAVFFVVGEQVLRRPALVRDVAAAGHLIALHGHSHRLQLRLPRAVVEQDVKRGVAAVADAIGERPKWHRPPYGIYSDSCLNAIHAHGMRPLLWSRWGKDWRGLTSPERIARRASSNLNRGDVILLHDADFYSARGSHRRTAQALALILAELEHSSLTATLPT
jgi:peptidoglycan/xylan/chitin deacetylase (PgdA/CDA1 family)